MQRHARKTMKLLFILSIVAGNDGLIAQPSPIQGLPASDSLSAEDIWQNPTFVGGVVNGGPTAHSEW